MAGPIRVPLSRFWPEIRESTGEHATTAKVWQKVHDRAAELGVKIQAGSFNEMNRLRGIASRQQYAIETFRKLSADAEITSHEMAPDIISRPANLQSLVKEFKVQYQHITERDGKQQTIWRTDYFPMSLPSSKGDLIDILSQEGQMLTQQGGSDEGAESIGIGDVLVMQV